MRIDELMRESCLEYPQMTRIAIFGNDSWFEIFSRLDLSKILNSYHASNLLGDFPSFNEVHRDDPAYLKHFSFFSSKV